MDHILRWCPFAIKAWRLLGATYPFMQHSQTSIVDWILDHLNPKNNGQVWSIQFGLMCWKLWEARNKRIFQNDSMKPVALALPVNVLVEYTLRASNTYRLFDRGR